MEWSGSLPVSSRRTLVALGVAAVLCAASTSNVLQAELLAQTPAPAAQAPAADGLKFNSDTPILIVFGIKPEKVADFEAAWAGIRAGFAKATDKPDLKAFGDTLNKMYKVDFSIIGPVPPGAPVLYVLQLDQPSKTVSYNPGKIIYETLYNNGAAGGLLTRPEADDLYAKIKDSYSSINPWPLVKVGG